MRNFAARHPFIARALIALLILAVIIALCFGGWWLAWTQGWTNVKPSLEIFTNPAKVLATTEEYSSEPTPEVIYVTPEPTAAPPAATPTPIVVYVTPEPTAAPPAATPTPIVVYVTPEPQTPTEPPVVQPTETPTVTITSTGKNVKFTLDGGTEVTLGTFTYAGGWQRNCDPWFVARANNLEKESPEAFGISIPGDDWASRISNWLVRAVSDPWTMTWFRFQMSIETDFADMAAVNRRAQEIAALPAEEYDRLANETLSKFFKKVNGGRAETSTEWALEVMMHDTSDGTTPELLARLNGDSNHTPDTLITFYAKGEDTSFISAKKAWRVAAAAAGANTDRLQARAWINLTEGGTWKWKAKGGSVNPPPSETTPPPSETTPPPATTTPPPAVTPTPTPRPTKDPGQRPTVTDAPIGGGETDPQHSSDPQTTSAPTSTPRPQATATPRPTAAPTPVPTAVVRPTEVCTTPVATPIREDTNPTPAPQETHNVPTKPPEISTDPPAGTGFDPGSI